MNQIMSCIPVGSGWYIQVLLPDGKLQWVPCVGSFQEAIDDAVRWKSEKGETT
ncbi:hypothetical protein [uncultured Oscillibacter sp.]|jgi:hypothetical protein|uniref:hypothetical protein n=1 Tax=uncultured Oscillibacter sp. TaxID=876091 RepID=UPI0025CD81F2|nr:hypothetical protein [uncultured Oscillibacter sp.]